MYLHACGCVWNNFASRGLAGRDWQGGSGGISFSKMTKHWLLNFIHRPCNQPAPQFKLDQVSRLITVRANLQIPKSPTIHIDPQTILSKSSVPTLRHGKPTLVVVTCRKPKPHIHQIEAPPSPPSPQLQVQKSLELSCSCWWPCCGARTAAGGSSHRSS